MECRSTYLLTIFSFLILPSSSLPYDVNKTVKVESSVINLDESEIKHKTMKQNIYSSNNTADNLPVLHEIKKLDDHKIVDNTVEVVNKNNMIECNKQSYEIQIENELADTSDVKLYTECNSNYPHYYSNDSSTSDTLSDVNEKNSISINKKPFYQQYSKLDDNKIDLKKKKQKKKILDLNECSSWEDLYDKDDESIRPWLMKEVSSYTFFFFVIHNIYNYLCLY